MEISQSATLTSENVIAKNGVRARWDIVYIGVGHRFCIVAAHNGAHMPALDGGYEWYLHNTKD